MKPGLLASFLWLCTIVRCSSSLPTTTTTTTITIPASNSSVLNLWDYLPHAWSAFCSVDYTLNSNVTATIICHVTPHQKTTWRLDDFRKSLSSLVNSTGIELALRIECETGGTISLPFPFRAPGLVKLTVLYCGLLDKWADFDSPARNLGDWLRVQELWSCMWVNDFEDLAALLRRLKSMDSHYQCGQDSTLVSKLAYNITEVERPRVHRSPESSVLPKDKHLDMPAVSTAKNDSKSLADTEISDLAALFLNAGGSSGPATSTDDPRKTTNQGPGEGSSGGPVEGAQGGAGSLLGLGNFTSAEELLQIMVDLDNLKTPCNYEHLEVYDESYTKYTNVNHFEFMVKETTYPKLRILNFTGIGLVEIPKELRESRRKFHGSKLGIIDLSYNYVQELGLIMMYPSRGIPTTLLVRHNNITKLNLRTFQDLALVPDYEVDLEGNPIACDCDMKEFLLQLQKDDLWTPPGMKYYRDHLSALTCATPAQLSGRLLGSLSTDELTCPVSVADLRAVMAVMVVIVVILLILLALAVRYRKEVRILMYTRVNILLPCGLPQSATLPEKTYDAFVAYAHQDSDWVLGSLMTRLEDAEATLKGRKPCKLCLHQRDFVVGKPIIDNIVDSIAASRHTIVVLTNSFVRSGWAMEELEHAYRQSIEERRRHLVVVVLEDVPQSEMGAVLRRCCKTFTYLQVSDTFFWDRLLYSLQVANHDSKSKKRPSLNAPDDGYDTPTSGNSNKGYNSDEKTGVISPAEVTLTEEVKKALFLETMRTLSVESTYSTISETAIPVTPSQVQPDRPLFEHAA
ncbi:hypothetical protein ACOMHN_032877 [Nucella lapillus]